MSWERTTTPQEIVMPSLADAQRSPPRPPPGKMGQPKRKKGRLRASRTVWGLGYERGEELPGALWTRSMIDDSRKPVKLPDMLRIVVAVDPSGARDMNEQANSRIGIVVAGRGVDGRGYVLADRSCKLPPAVLFRLGLESLGPFHGVLDVLRTTRQRPRSP